MAMIIKSHKKLPLLSTDRGTVLPVLPLRSAIIFPGDIHTIQIGRNENLQMLDAVVSGDSLMVLSFAPKRVSGSAVEISEVGVMARVQSTKPAITNSQMVTIEGLQRVALLEVKKATPYIKASVGLIKDENGDPEMMEGIISEIMDSITNLVTIDNRYTSELVYTFEMNRSDPGKFIDRIGAMIHFDLLDKQQIIETVELPERLDLVRTLLTAEIDKISTSLQINTRVTESLERKKRENFLRQQLMEIRRELGEEFIEEDVAKTYQNRIKSDKGIPRQVADRLNSEADRLKHLSSSSAEYGFTKNYIDLLLSLPWDHQPEKQYDLKKVEESINAGYYGLDKVKEQVLEYLAVRQMSKTTYDNPILCLSGAVGTGKASLVKAIATSLDRKLVRINGASMIMVEDIKGIHRTDIGAGPGQIVRAIRRAETFDLIVYLEDLEYTIESEDSNALLALMEAVDPRQNGNFVDNFVGIPLDFSRILFILGLSNSDDFPEPFIHRLELVEMPGYIESEKIAITRRHILPKLYKRHGLTRTELKFSDKALMRIIRQYTMEAGLIGLQQQLEKIFRRTTRKKAALEECHYTVNDTNVDKYLGTPPFVPEKAMQKPEIGVANGLAWTGAGGDLMLIEGLKMKGSGQVIYTGSLGEVMKESIQAAHSFVRARAETLGIDHEDFLNFDIHIHFPMGAIPKDGPSAGVTVTMVIASVMAERPLRNDIGMTGEVTLRGKVISVGGIKEKVSAAYRAGITNIVIPKENEKDIKDIPKEIKRKTKFILVESVDELFELALLDFTPSSYTLEKLFQQEIEKARRRGRGKTKSRTKKPARTKRPAAKGTKKKRQK